MKDDTEDSGTPISDEAAGTIEEGTESVRRTIVGGRPLDRRRRKVRIPIGIEKVLCAAAADREFHEQLLMARADALPGSGLEISPSEAVILSCVSEDALRTMIENIDLKRHRRRRFFRGIAAASLAATTATVGVGCLESGDASGGERADEPTWEDVTVVPPVDVFDAQNDLVDVGSTDGSPDLLDAETVMQDVGITGDEIGGPEDIMEVEEAMDVGNWADSPPEVIEPTDADEVDVDIQPMPAGIPPVEDVKEPK